ncbi:hypothetical protein Tco_1069792 [Tanacetum coccineum]|uniref:Protein kinase-like domain, concanavalin A-like lectin/glucanase domain protein n=1 Tax=Tanacetum coccineum TaxID=301880 RepID=A0ABQ5HJX0_9ASTR
MVSTKDKSSSDEPSCLEGEPEFESIIGKQESGEFEEEIEEEVKDEEEEDELEYFNIFPTREELEYHEWILKKPRPFWVRAKVRKWNLILEDVSSVTDHYLGEMVLGKPFVKESKLIHDRDEGTVMFEKNNERVTFKMLYKLERFKDIEDLNTDNIPPFFIKSKGDEEKGEGYVSMKRMTYYSECLNLGPEYKRDKGIIKTITFLNGRSSSMNDEGVT